MKDYPGAFLSLLFFARDAAHREHLKTRSYAAHVALNEFYDGVIDLADKFAEAYQGLYDLIGEFPLMDGDVSDIVDELGKHLKWIDENRAEICDDSAIQNIIDEIVALYASTLYKLRFLK